MQEREILADAVLSMSPPKIALETRHLDQTYPAKETPPWPSWGQPKTESLQICIERVSKFYLLDIYS
jgi:hypothetical protein